MAALVFILPLFVVIYILIQKYQIHKAFRDVVDKIPGPPAIFPLGNVLQFSFDKIVFSAQLENLAWTFGQKGMFRIWLGHRPVIFLTRAHSAEALLSSNKVIEKSAQYDNYLKIWLGDGLLISGGDKWRSRRKMLTPTFHFSILNSFIEIYNDQSIIFMEQIKSMADQNLPFDIFSYIGRCALDIICETAMGVKVNAQLNHKSEYVQSVNIITEIVFKYERMPWLWVKPIFYLLGYARRYYRCLDILQGFTRRVIRERFDELKKIVSNPSSQSEKKKPAFLDLLLDMQEENKLTMEDIREEVDTFMFEGHDTTASGMGWTLFLLGHYPDVQEKVYQELESIFGDSKETLPTAEDLKKMKYLECVIKESLRLYPPVPMFARRVDETFELNGYVIPKGASLMVFPLIIHRDPEIFGEDSFQFNPDRFFMPAATGRNPFAFVPFSAGSRNCIGQKFAMMEEKVIISTFLRHYKIHSEDKIESVRPIPDLILRPPKGFNVRISHRNED